MPRRMNHVYELYFIAMVDFGLWLALSREAFYVVESTKMKINNNDD